jgi:hypothetical protein
MKRLFFTVGIFFVLLFAVFGTGHALSVTLVKGDSALSSAPVAAFEEPIVLSFGTERVVIHDGRQAVQGKLLNSQDVALKDLYLVRDHRAKSRIGGYDTLYTHGPFRLAVVKDPGPLSGVKKVRLWPVTRSMVVTAKPAGPKAAPDPKVQALLNKLNRTRYGQYMALLARDLDTRYSCAYQAMTARNKIRNIFKNLGLQTNIAQYFPNECEAGCDEPRGYNVIGIKKGKTRPGQFYLVGAHYDSANDDGGACDAAPGACDNASGVAAVIELARVFRTVDTEASIVFVAFGGEEIDLLGSRKYVQELIDNEEQANLKAFVVLDMISFYNSAETQGIYIEGSRENTRQSRALDRLVRYVGTYTDLKVEGTANYSNSDHEPLLDEGIPGGLLIQMDCTAETYEQLHTAEDTIGHQDLPFAIEVTKVAAALLAEAVIMDE